MCILIWQVIFYCVCQNIVPTISSEVQTLVNQKIFMTTGFRIYKS